MCSFKFLIRSVAMGLLLGTSAQAGTISFPFTAGTGNVGSNSLTDTVSGYSITAYGYDANGTAHNLFLKNGGGDEQGLGLTGTFDNELSLSSGGHTYANFIQIDVSKVLSSSISGSLEMGSVTNGEKYDVYGSNTLGSLGTSLLTGQTTEYPNFISIPSWGSYKYIGVTVTPNSSSPSNNVLVDAFAINAVPEPASVVMMATSLVAGLGLVVVRKRNRQIAA